MKTSAHTQAPSGDIAVALTQGLLGFEAYTQFTLVPNVDQTPFHMLQSEEVEELGFMCIDPQLVVKGYEFDLSDEDVAELGIQSVDDVLVLVLVTIPEDPRETTANLLGPLVINRQTGVGKQVVLSRSDYPVRFPVFGEAGPC